MRWWGRRNEKSEKEKVDKEEDESEIEIGRVEKERGGESVKGGERG